MRNKLSHRGETFSLVERLKATEDLKLVGELQWAEV